MIESNFEWSVNMKRCRNVNVNARQIVTIAIEKGYTHNEIAEICDVSVGSIKRWMSTGRADANKIKALEREIGQIYLQPDAVGDILIEIYKKRKRRFRLKTIDLKKIAGRSALRGVFVEQLIQYMLDNGYFMLETFEGEEDFFIVISIRQSLRHVEKYLNPSEINNYFREIADEFPDDEEDNE